MIRLFILVIISTIRFWQLIIVGLLDSRPRCITCGKRYQAINGMFGECSECVLGPAYQPVYPVYSEEEVERNNRLAFAVFNAIKNEEPLEVPVFDDDDLESFTFGVDAYGNIVVRQVDDDGDITWQYIGQDE